MIVKFDWNELVLQDILRGTIYCVCNSSQYSESKVNGRYMLVDILLQSNHRMSPMDSAMVELVPVKADTKYRRL